MWSRLHKSFITLPFGGCKPTGMVCVTFPFVMHVGTGFAVLLTEGSMSGMANPSYHSSFGYIINSPR